MRSGQKKAPSPNDWVYVYDFEKPEAPRAIELPQGMAKKLKKKVDNLVKDLRQEIPAALQSEDYENAINTYLSASNERKTKLYAELEKHAKSMGFNLKSSRMGIETIPMVDGRQISEKEYAKLEEKERLSIESKRSKLEPDVLDFARKVRSIENETREYILTLRNDLGLAVVGNLIDPVVEEFQHYECEALFDYFDKFKEDILENLLDFVDLDEEGEEELPVDDRDVFKKYGINVFVDNSKAKGAPVVLEMNPTFYNVFGKIEKNVEHGIYNTDFSMIKNGAIHRANGGYLVLNALDLFKAGTLWEALKRTLRNQEAYIEDMGEQFSMLPTSGLRPQPIPLDIKVILIGNDEIYHILLEEDEEFHKIFKIKADFDYKMKRQQKNINSYVSFIATRSSRDNLLPFDRGAVSAIVEFSSRSVEDQSLLSTQFGQIKDLTIEADYLAREDNARVVKRKHVEEALDLKFYRLNLIEEHLFEMVRNKDILLTIDGERVGQINALTVYDMGDFSFGKPCRITCTTSISDDGIINIERASRLSGRTHDKGMMIISGYLNAVLAREHSLGVSASVCFEQSYGLIDGDSASTAELVVILSAMAGIPIRQNYAITGSINQMGEVQAVGGINEKVEGFYKICKLVGGKGPYNLILPRTNVQNLMLHRDVVAAVRSGFLRIFPINYLWEAFELTTGVQLGIKDIQAKTFTKGSAMEMIKTKLDELYHEEEKHPPQDHDQHKQHKQLRAAKSKS